MSYHVSDIMLDAGDARVNKTNVILALVEFAAIKCVCVHACVCICNDIRDMGETQR